MIAASLSTVLLVPGEALNAGVAGAASIIDRQGLFGGVTPAPFVATEAISHGFDNGLAACSESFDHRIILGATRAMRDAKHQQIYYILLISWIKELVRANCFTHQ
ncbi:hypothetical protein SR41_10060 [Sphingomonas melonis]|uniref:Uncharacterized protein n=1 Tax=Sphingomonas melonis TaxID=152682 RepID=A0A0D1KT71_9SPHN|nr:DUF3182 family protein [Sphingomonas melonis]KIU27664.1 hypothetical protein SR41_10060 [Sphingomonas melonis]